MKRVPVLFLVVVLVGCRGSKETSASKDELTRQELAKLQGTWKVVADERGGKPVDKSQSVVGTTYTFAGDKLTVSFNPESGTVVLDPVATPRHMDVRQPRKGFFDTGGSKVPLSEADEAKLDDQGIYELDGDNLKICFDNALVGITDDGKQVREITLPPRPSSFTTKAGSRAWLMILKREKP